MNEAGESFYEEIVYTFFIKFQLQCLQKKSQELFFQYSVTFSPAEYDYESHFFSSRPDFTNFYDKGLKFNKIRCL